MKELFEKCDKDHEIFKLYWNFHEWIVF